MLHIVTVHWKDDRWVDIQLQYLRRYISREFRVYAFLNDLPDVHRTKYFYASTERIRSHAVKLNVLADMAGFNATSPEDWLMFLDGDAFPIADLVSFARPLLKTCPLLAVQRRENNGDVQPHPSFCLTTVGFWKSIEGDWHPGHQWTNAQGELVSDVGGNLLGILERHEIRWHPMVRSNRKNLHPLLFGLYDDVIYHHGLGFRTGPTRIGLQQAMAEGSPEESARSSAIAENERLSKAVFESIQRDPFFYRDFQ